MGRQNTPQKHRSTEFLRATALAFRPFDRSSKKVEDFLCVFFCEFCVSVACSFTLILVADGCANSLRARYLHGSRGRRRPPMKSSSSTPPPVRRGQTARERNQQGPCKFRGALRSDLLQSEGARIPDFRSPARRSSNRCDRPRFHARAACTGQPEFEPRRLQRADHSLESTAFFANNFEEQRR